MLLPSSSQYWPKSFLIVPYQIKICITHFGWHHSLTIQHHLGHHQKASRVKLLCVASCLHALSMNKLHRRKKRKVLLCKTSLLLSNRIWPLILPQYLIRNHFGRYKDLQSYIPLKEQSLHKSKKSQTHNEVYGNLLLRQNSLGLADCSPHGTVLQVWILHMQQWKKKKSPQYTTAT